MTINAQMPRRGFVQMAALAGLSSMMPAFASPIGSGAPAALRDAIVRQREDTIRRMREWIALPSIAAEKLNIAEGAAQMAAILKDAGFQRTDIIPTPGSPAVLGILDVGAPKTVAVYFMYDVKQFDPAEWSSPPLEGRIVADPDFGKVLIGRGAVNQKGPQIAFLAALHALRATGRQSPVNIVLLAEGEEEVGSINLPGVVHTPEVMKELSRCMGIFSCNASQSPAGDVTIDLGAKGDLEVELFSSGAAWGRGSNQDIHSGYAAYVDSPAWHLVKALATLTSPDGTDVAIDGWFDNVIPITAEQRRLIAAQANAGSEASIKKMLGVERWIKDMSYPEALERLATAPTANIEGIVGGYTGPGGKTIMPTKASAKIDFRLVPNQTAEDCLAKLRAHLAKRGFGDIEIKTAGGSNPTQTPESSPMIQAAKTAYLKMGVQPAINLRNPTSGPGYLFTDPPLRLGWGDIGLGHGARFHAPNEYYVIESTKPGLQGLDGATLSFAEYLFALAAIRA
jgi:acetylornithine deacetylase/succinyl-diaminopimelate desuccinylase-like protein